MSRTKRFIFNIILWLALWSFGLLLTNGGEAFLQKNWPAFIMQIVVVAVLIFYTAPAFLFKKKYVIFTLASLALLVFSSFLISNNIGVPLEDQPPPIDRRPPRGAGENPGPPGQNLAPPQFMIHFLILGLAYVLATFVETFVFAQKKEEETIRNKSEQMQTELKLLKSQINPHFLFNSLNNIYALSVLNSNKTQEGISHLSDMLRYVLYECEAELVPLKKELDYIENYLELFALKSTKAYPITSDFKMVNTGVQVAPMIFIAFIENALKHSNIEQSKTSFIRMKLRADADEILFEIENSVPKIAVQKDAVGGIGIENVKRRLALLYPNQHSLKVVEKEGIFKVQLQINLR